VPTLRFRTARRLIDRPAEQIEVRLGDRSLVNPLSVAPRLVIIESLGSEFAKPACVAMLMLTWTVLPDPAALWMVIACPDVVTTAISLMISILKYLLARLGVGEAPQGGAVSAACDQLLSVCLSLPRVAINGITVVDAFARASGRMLASRRHLLEWVASPAGCVVNRLGIVGGSFPSEFAGMPTATGMSRYCRSAGAHRAIGPGSRPGA
jgi:hypothetical protein